MRALSWIQRRNDGVAAGSLLRPVAVPAFLARDSIICLARYAIARPSVCQSVRHTGGSVKNPWS